MDIRRDGPGRCLHVRQGDTVDFTLVNRANIPHRLDFHAAEIAPSRYYTNVMPGRFAALSVRGEGSGGVHVSLWHRAGGDGTATDVRRTRWWIRLRRGQGATELALAQSEFHLSGKPDQDGTRGSTGRSSGEGARPIVFNCCAGEYAGHPSKSGPTS